ncbi:MAG: hypothetical protein KDD35_03460 [Bdellovibrionales bacterium]|nr:hypothetical protein [Bdellovibrionales bacterium]
MDFVAKLKYWSWLKVVLFAFMASLSYPQAEALPTTKSMKTLCRSLMARVSHPYWWRKSVKKGDLASSRFRLNLERVPLIDLPAEYLNELYHIPFKIVDVYKGLHGGHRLVLETQWVWADDQKIFDDTEVRAGDVTIDLRFFPYLLGPDVAFFFGYQIIDDHHLTVPTYEEIEGAIEKYNEGLSFEHPDYWPIRHYKSHSVFENEKTFIDRFINDFRKPISLVRRGFYHDISTHVMESLFAPKNAIIYTQQVIAVGKRFFDAYSNFLDKDSVYRMRSEMASQIDNLGNTIGGFIPKELRGYFQDVSKKLIIEKKENEIKKNPFEYKWVNLRSTFFSWSQPLIGVGYVYIAEEFFKGPEVFYRQILSDAPRRDKLLLEHFFEKDHQINPTDYQAFSADLVSSYGELADYLNHGTRGTSLMPILLSMQSYSFASDFVRRVRRIQNIIPAILNPKNQEPKDILSE